MSGKREPWREVLLVVTVLIVGIFFALYAYTRNQEDDGVTAIAVARQLNVRGYRLEELVQRDNPGATLDWQAVAGDGAMVRVGVKATRDGVATEYRFDVDIPTGRVHAANPHARALLDEGPDPRE